MIYRQSVNFRRYFFADYTTTTTTAIDKQQQKIQTDLDFIGNWLKTNRLAFNFEKRVQVTLISNIGLTFEIDGTQIESKPVCKYLSVYADFKLCFNTHLNVVLEKLGKQSGIVSELRHGMPRSQMILFYKTNIQQLFNLVYSFMVAAATLAYYLL